MADVVQYRLERMLDELDDLERRGLFTRREIAEIVKKRRQFEYRLKRPRPLKKDFLAYIDYESHFDSLRKLRKKAVVATSNSTNSNLKKSISDTAPTRRILDIYRRAVVRHKGDIDLWFRYLEFCRQRGHGRMKQVLAQVLRFHPKVPGLWIYAAAWEFDHNLNVAAARALMQSGLRVCADSEDLWVEYLRMELTYLNKLKARRAALEKDDRTFIQDSSNAEEKSWIDENKDLYMSLDETRVKEDNSGAQEANKEKEVEVFREQGLLIFRTIYSGAVEAIPLSMSLHKRFLEVLEQTDLVSKEKLKEEIMSNLRKDFYKDEDYWDWHARLKIDCCKKGQEMMIDTVLSQLEEAAQVYEEALNVVPSAKMFSLYASFWLDVIAPEQGDLQNCGDGIIADHGTEFTSRLLEVYSRASSNGCLTEDLAHQYISCYLQLGEIDKARNLAKELCDGVLSAAAKVWVLRASIEMKWLMSKFDTIDKNYMSSLFGILQKAVSKVAISEAESLWFMAIKVFSNNKVYFDKLVQNFLFLMAKDSGDESNSSVAVAIINCLIQRHGTQNAREVYNRILALPHPSLATYRHCIELESNLASINDTNALSNVRRLYESALSIYKQNVTLWQDYYFLELKLGTSDAANAVLWRARKTVGEKIKTEL